MLMTTFLSKCCIKRFSCRLVCALVVAILVSAGFVFSKCVEMNVMKYVDDTPYISTQNIQYQFPHKFILKNVIFLGSKPVISISKLEIRFSVAKFLIEKQLLLSGRAWVGLTDGEPIFFQGEAKGNEFFLEKLEFKGKEFEVKLWKDPLNQGQARFKGYAFISGKHQYHVLDINSRIQITSERVSIKNMSFAFNHVPVGLDGDIIFSDKGVFNLSASVYPRNARAHMPVFFAALKEVQKIDLHIEGGRQEMGIMNQGNMDVYFVDKSRNRKIAVKKINLAFKDLFINSFTSLDEINIRLNEVEIKVSGLSKERRVSLRNLEALLNLNDSKNQFINFHGPFYGGDFQGKFQVADGEVSANLYWNDIDIRHFAKISSRVPEIQGRLDGKAIFDRDAEFNIQGEFLTKKGRLTDSVILKYLQENLDFPTLDHIDFERIAAKFFVNAKECIFTDVRVDYKDVELQGYFQLDQNSLLSSKFSVMLSRSFMRERDQLKALARRLKDEVDPVRFDFQLSGSLDAVNMQWLSSSSKEKLQKRIPKFVQRKLERRLMAKNTKDVEEKQQRK